MRPEGAITGSKKTWCWKAGKARAKKENEAQGQWAVEDLDYATQKATKMWIRNNGSGTCHGYPKT